MRFEEFVACGPFLMGTFDRIKPTREAKSVFREKHTPLQHFQSHSSLLNVSGIHRPIRKCRIIITGVPKFAMGFHQYQLIPSTQNRPQLKPQRRQAYNAMNASEQPKK